MRYYLAAVLVMAAIELPMQLPTLQSRPYPVPWGKPRRR